MTMDVARVKRILSLKGDKTSKYCHWICCPEEASSKCLARRCETRVSHKLFYTSEQRDGKRLENGVSEREDTELY